MKENRMENITRKDYKRLLKEVKDPDPERERLMNDAARPFIEFSKTAPLGVTKESHIESMALAADRAREEAAKKYDRGERESELKIQERYKKVE